MTDLERGSDRLGRRAKRFLTPLQRYEVWLQLVGGETTISEAADRLGGPLDGHAAAHGRQGRGASGAVGVQARWTGRQAGSGAGGGQGGGGPAGRGGPGAGRQAGAGGGKRALGRSGQVLPRVDAATKAGLLGLLVQALQQGWTVRAVCQVLEVGELRIYRWLGRRAAGELADQAWVAARCMACSRRRSPRSCGCSPSGRGRPLPSQARAPRLVSGAGGGLSGQRAPGAGARGPAAAAAAPTGPQRPQAVPGLGGVHPQLHLGLRHDPLHPGWVAATVIEDLVSRKWLAEIVSAEETSTRSRSWSPTRWRPRAAGADQRPPRRPGRPHHGRSVPADPAGPQRQRTGR
jgi:hypothetical protein